MLGYNNGNFGAIDVQRLLLSYLYFLVLLSLVWGQKITRFGDSALQDVTRARAALFDEAVKRLHMKLLRDLRPPWLTHNFPQALPGDGILSRFTRPSFLQWDVIKMKVLFGERVTAIPSRVAAAVSVEIAVRGRCTCAWTEGGNPSLRSLACRWCQIRSSSSRSQAASSTGVLSA